MLQPQPSLQKLGSSQQPSPPGQAPRPSGLHCAACNLQFSSFPEVRQLWLMFDCNLFEVEQHLSSTIHTKLSPNTKPTNPAHTFKHYCAQCKVRSRTIFHGLLTSGWSPVPGPDEPAPQGKEPPGGPAQAQGHVMATNTYTNMNKSIKMIDHMLSYGISNSFQPYFGPPLTCQPNLPFNGYN